MWIFRIFGWFLNFVIRGPCHKFVSKICFMCGFLEPCHKCCSKNFGWECLSFVFREPIHGCYFLDLVDVWFMFQTMWKIWISKICGHERVQTMEQLKGVCLILTLKAMWYTNKTAPKCLSQSFSFSLTNLVNIVPTPRLLISLVNCFEGSTLWTWYGGIKNG